MKWMTEKGREDLERAAEFRESWWNSERGPAGPILLGGAIAAVIFSLVVMAM